MERITSRQNSLVSRFRDAARGPGSTLLLEGAGLLTTALESGVVVEVAAVRTATNDPDPALRALLTRLERGGVRLVSVSDPVMDALSPVQTPSGIVALAKRPTTAADLLVVPHPAFVLVLFGVQDPGNVGAILRSADAAGATGVITTPGCADPFGWKALRGAMGSTFRVPVWTGVPWADALGFARAHGLQVVAAEASATRAFSDHAWQRATCLLLGAEGTGLPAEALADAEARVAIPMRAGVESLNVAVTAALITYEARRQRQRPGRASQ